MTHQITIALIDNDESIRKALRRLLHTKGYSVETFASAEEFLEATGFDRPDCLLLDLRLIGINGLELQQHLLATNQSIPLLFLTSHQDETSQRVAMQAGAIDVLGKPVDSETLLDSIQKAIESV